MPLVSGTKLGPYEISGPLGAGGMGEVYRALDRRHDRAVAVKMLRQDVSTHVGAGRFLREIRIAAQLTHPHILPLIDSGEAGGALFYSFRHLVRQAVGRAVACALE
jgi:eukaryotic-like serine/threonine-protein kinase